MPKKEKISREAKKQMKANKKRGGGLNTSYLTKMGAHNLIANRSMSFSSISVLSACLLLIGISMIIILNIQNLVQDVEKQNVIIAFVDDGADDAQIAKVGTDLVQFRMLSALNLFQRKPLTRSSFVISALKETFLRALLKILFPMLTVFL